MTRLQRAILPARTLRYLRRNARPAAVDMVHVSVKVKAPISPTIRRLLESARHTKGAWTWSEGDYLIFVHPVKTCYPANFPGFAREVVAAMRAARREGKRVCIVRHV